MIMFMYMCARMCVCVCVCVCLCNHQVCEAAVRAEELEVLEQVGRPPLAVLSAFLIIMHIQSYCS
jgi:hypothetical protein